MKRLDVTLNLTESKLALKAIEKLEFSKLTRDEQEAHFNLLSLFGELSDDLEEQEREARLYNADGDLTDDGKEHFLTKELWLREDR